MAEEKDYMRILDRARKRKKRAVYGRYAAIAAAVVIAAGGILFAGRKFGGNEGNADTPAPISEQDEPAAASVQEADIQAQQEAAERQAVVDSYENLGLVQVEDFLRVRETPGRDGMEIGKIYNNGACDILGTETVEGSEGPETWYKIHSGEVEGYVLADYVIIGDEARQKALEAVGKYVVIDGSKLEGDSLRYRSEPNTDNDANILGEVRVGERFAVEEELDGWVKIKQGYVSSDYVTMEVGLGEAEKLSEKVMAINRQYKNLFVSKVDTYQNVRSEPENKGDSNVIGKLTSMAGGEILEKLDGWYKIKSGNITGYISADPELVATGAEAKDLAVNHIQRMAIVNTDALNVRAEPNTESKIWTRITKEERYSVVDVLEDNWVEIELDTGDSDDGSNHAYISTRDNNAEVRYALNEAVKFSPLKEAENQQMSLRNKVVNYALKFVGGRYVWGGTNPNTGADCSGFVQYVMRNAAGVSLPRTSREQAKVGRAVKSSEMKPGDLIFYANSGGTINHVAMYIGNGQIVHAASRRSGIKISTWNYRTPKVIRSVLD